MANRGFRTSLDHLDVVWAQMCARCWIQSMHNSMHQACELQCLAYGISVTPGFSTYLKMPTDHASFERTFCTTEVVFVCIENHMLD